MEKQEFLDKLRSALSGRLASEIVADTVRYYEDYINTEIRMGREEQEVMAALGDPRLIARTIIETKGGQSGGIYSDQSPEEEERPRQYRSVPGWVWILLVLILIVLIISAVFQFLRVFGPVLIVMAVVLFLVKFFRDWFN